MFEASVRAAVRGNMHLQMARDRSIRMSHHDILDRRTQDIEGIALRQNQCDFVLGDPVAWQRGAGSPGVDIVESRLHHIPLPSGAVFGMVVPSGLFMQVAISSEAGIDEDDIDPADGRRGIDVIEFRELCLSAESDYARYARLRPEAAHSIAEGMQLAAGQQGGPHRMALVLLAEGGSRLRLPLPPSVAKLWERLGRHARAAACPAVHEELRRSIRAYAARCVEHARAHLSTPASGFGFSTRDREGAASG